MKFISKYWTSIAILIAGIIAAVANFYASKQDSEQKNKIEELGKKINEKMDKTSVENLITGELEMDFSVAYNDDDVITVIVGGMTMTDPIKTIKERGGFGGLISLGDYEPVKIKIENGKLLVSLIVYDVNGNLIAEIENNNWRPNKNFTGKFNYDKKGLEVINNQGEIAVNLDIVGVNKIIIQGFFPYKIAHRIMVAGDIGFRTIPFGTKEIEKKIFELTGKEYEDFKNETIQQLGGIRQLFEYTGKDWLGKRKSTH